MSIPTTERAIIIKGPKEAELVYDHPVPKVRLGYILVKNVAVALNPTDWKHSISYCDSLQYEAQF